ncbi:YidB family protein [Rhizobium populisoli]|uniref:YidB family protein n=1 Tax=Rhizobium populisoli TaxID=2859785 RepID=UPI001CA54B33|nr:YidB family protein [Rhizobium populisoli]
MPSGSLNATRRPRRRGLSKPRQDRWNPQRGHRASSVGARWRNARLYAERLHVADFGWLRRHSIINGGLSDLIDWFKQAGQERKAESWVKPGANEPIDDSELASALGPDVLRDIAARTGLSEEEVLKRLSKNLPDAVDGLTPDGSFPPASPI